jgi:hypothetical protein
MTFGVVMEEIEEVEFEEFTLQHNTSMCHNSMAHGTKFNYVHHVDVQLIEREKPPFKNNDNTKLLVSPCKTFDNRMAMTLPYEMKGMYFAAVTSHNNGKRFTNDPDGKHEV